MWARRVVDKTDFEREVETNYRWNFSVNVLDGAFFEFGMNLVSAETVVALLVSQLTASKVVIGLIPAIHSLGFLLPQLLSASLAERLPRKKSFVNLWSGLGERGPFLLMGPAVLWLAKPAPMVALMSLLLFSAISSVSGGIATPSWADVIAKVIPERKRGLFFGARYSLGALLSIAGAAIAGWILERWSFPRNYGLCFMVTSVALGISAIAFALNREPQNPTVKPRVSLVHYLRQLPGVLRRDRNYARYLISRSVGILGGMAGGFFMVYGASRFDISGTVVGGLTAVLVGSQAVMNLVWGVVGGRRGYKVVLCGAALSMVAATLITQVAPSSAWLWATFALMGISRAGDSAAGMSMILGLCAPEDRPTYVGLTNGLLAPASAIAPLLGGWLATLAGYQGMFVVALFTGVLGALLMTIWVSEPRRVR